MQTHSNEHDLGKRLPTNLLRLRVIKSEYLCHLPNNVHRASSLANVFSGCCREIVTPRPLVTLRSVISNDFPIRDLPPVVSHAEQIMYEYVYTIYI